MGNISIGQKIIMRHNGTITVTKIDEILRTAFPQGNIHIHTTDERHYSIEVADLCFMGKSLLEQHRLVNSVLTNAFKDGLHAVNIKTAVPTQQ